MSTRLAIEPIRLFRPSPQRRKAAFRCFCFPHAAASGYVFEQWRPLLKDVADICSLHLPGRSSNFNGTPYSEFQQLIEDAFAEIVPLLGERFVFFGHSLGGIIAYELARLLHHRGQSCPRHLFISAAGAPHLPDPPTAHLTKADHRLSDIELIERVRLATGTPEDLIHSREFMELMLPIVRADLRVADSYVLPPTEEREVPCDITVVGGCKDLLDVPLESLEAWAAYTTRRFRLRLLEAGHFYLKSHAKELTDLVRSTVVLGMTA